MEDGTPNGSGSTAPVDREFMQAIEAKVDGAAAPVGDSDSPRRATYSSVVRLAAGAVGVVVHRAQQADVGVEAEPQEEIVAPAMSIPGEVVIGFAADLPDRIGRISSAVANNTGAVRSVVSFGWRVTAASPIGWLISKPVDAVRAVFDAETDRLAAIGRKELARGVIMVEAVVDDTIDGVLDSVGESDALNELIREQTLGITDAAIREMRETGAAADNITDALVRKLLRRDPRPLPPLPAGSAE